MRAAPTPAVIADAREFRIRRVPLAAGETLAFGAGEQPRILSVVTGRVQADTPARDQLGRGDNVLLPCSGAFTFTAAPGGALLLVTENFG
jgi:mannose-6-phosphate isomerase